MKKYFFASLFLLMGLHARSAEPFNWLTDLDKANTMAVQSGKPLLVVFR